MPLKLSMDIHTAALNGDIDRVNRLIQQDTKGAVVVHALNASGDTALSSACQAGHLAIVELLLDHGADINHQGFGQQTPLHIAMTCSSIDKRLALVDLLLDQGADPGLCDRYGYTPLMEASSTTSSSSSSAAIVHRLLRHPSVVRTINHRNDEEGRTALHGACYKGHEEVVRMLLQSGADPTLMDGAGYTPMDITKKHRHRDCVLFLEEWERSYIITKARLLYDACHQAGTTTTTTTGGQGKAIVIPSYLKGRMEVGGAVVPVLPKVEMVEDRAEAEDAVVLVGPVVRYVICGGLKGELFVELMEMMGKTGVRAVT